MNEASSQTIYNWLASTQQHLLAAGIETARLDALVLLCDELQHEKSWVLANPDYILSTQHIHTLNNLIVQRIQHVPLAYIRGRAEFYGRDFAVNTNVLVPRPESESMITLLMRYTQTHPLKHVIDIGTGSGALAITAKIELQNVEVTATDIDAQCIQTAQKNAVALGATVEFLQSNLLAEVPALPANTALLCNLPYVPADYPINTAATHEPKLALFSGSDGLDHYRALFQQIDTLQNKPICIITESLMQQHIAISALADAQGYNPADDDGLAQLFVLATSSETS